MTMLRRLAFAALAVAALFAVSAEGAFARSVALVIGNGSYQNAPRLGAAQNDAADVAAALRRLGFEVVEATDADRAEMLRLLTQFQSDAAAADAAVLYFAGYGVGADDEGWLAPVDARLAAPTDAALETISATQAIAAVGGARTLRLVMLDASWAARFGRAQSDGQDSRRNTSQKKGGSAPVATIDGLPAIEPSGGALVWYAARAGSLSAPASGRNSPFATAFLKYVEQPGLELDKLFREISAEVADATGGRQTPWAYGARGREDFYFAGGAAASGGAGASTGGQDQAAYNLAMAIDESWARVLALRAFLELHPSSPLRADAERELSEAETTQPLLGAAPEGLDDETRERWERAMDGDAWAVVSIGYRYQNGIGGLPVDGPEAVRLYSFAAEQGYAHGQFNLGVMYRDGLGGLRKDEIEAVRLFKLSAAQGDPDAQVSLGVMHEEGRGGLRKDEAEAVRYYRLAAEQDNAAGQAYLGWAYEYGAGGIAADKDEAVRLYRLAAAQGNQYAKDQLQRLGVTEQ